MMLFGPGENAVAKVNTAKATMASSGIIRLDPAGA
jgi:hypothetical protein